MTRPPLPFLAALAWMPAENSLQTQAPVYGRSLFELWLSSGFVGPLLALGGCIAVVLALRRWLELRPDRLAPKALQQSLEATLHRGDVEAGLEAATGSRTVLGELVVAGLLLRRAGLDDMLSNVERASTREALRLGNRVANLARLGGVVLLVDLFGTTAGLMSTLQVIEILKEPTVSDFVRGILEALVCAALGLVVALFCFVAFFWLDARLTQRCLEVRDIAEELVREAAEKAHLD